MTSIPGNVPWKAQKLNETSFQLVPQTQPGEWVSATATQFVVRLDEYSSNSFRLSFYLGAEATGNVFFVLDYKKNPAGKVTLNAEIEEEVPVRVLIDRVGDDFLVGISLTSIFVDAYLNYTPTPSEPQSTSNLNTLSVNALRRYLAQAQLNEQPVGQITSPQVASVSGTIVPWDCGGGGVRRLNAVQDAEESQVVTFCSKTCRQEGQVPYPQIVIKAGTTQDYVDVTDAVFYISDTIRWDEPEPIPDNYCQWKYANPEDLKHTQFRLNPAYIGKYLRNGGDCKARHASQKIMSLYKGLEKKSITADEFYRRIMEYAMLKVFLWFLIYELPEFDMEVLYGANQCEFYDKLAGSRLCRFLRYFTEESSEIYNYDRFFKQCPGKH